MIYIKPSFFDDFKCVGGRCSDNCCIGWEIDIDDYAYEKYCRIDGQLGEKIRSSITESEDGSRCFKLAENDRCPFLNKNNLCDIIINCGESALCEICDEHPRFYEWFPGVTECGLGLSCVEVCRLLLTDPGTFALKEYNDGEKITLETRDDVAESDLYIITAALRECMFDVLSDNKLSLEDKAVKILEKAHKFTGEELKLSNDFNIVEKYKKTEPIDEKWTRYIDDLCNNIQSIKNSENDVLSDRKSNFLYSKILAYILYRHLVKAVFDNSYSQRVRFAMESLRFIMLSDMKTYTEKGVLSIDDRIENLKNWSKQIEYSDENTDMLIYGEVK